MVVVVEGWKPLFRGANAENVEPEGALECDDDWCRLVRPSLETLDGGADVVVVGYANGLGGGGG